MEKSKEGSFVPTKPSVGDVATFTICGRPADCEVLEVYDFGTVDVERLSDGSCFRITGLGWL